MPCKHSKKPQACTTCRDKEYNNFRKEEPVIKTKYNDCLFCSEKLDDTMIKFIKKSGKKKKAYKAQAHERCIIRKKKLNNLKKFRVNNPLNGGTFSKK